MKQDLASGSESQASLRMPSRQESQSRPRSQEMSLESLQTFTVLNIPIDPSIEIDIEMFVRTLESRLQIMETKLKKIEKGTKGEKENGDDNIIDMKVVQVDVVRKGYSSLMENIYSNTAHLQSNPRFAELRTRAVEFSREIERLENEIESIRMSSSSPIIRSSRKREEESCTNALINKFGFSYLQLKSSEDESEKLKKPSGPQNDSFSSRSSSSSSSESPPEDEKIETSKISKKEVNKTAPIQKEEEQESVPSKISLEKRSVTEMRERTDESYSSRTGLRLRQRMFGTEKQNINRNEPFSEENIQEQILTMLDKMKNSALNVGRMIQADNKNLADVSRLQERNLDQTTAANKSSAAHLSSSSRSFFFHMFRLAIAIGAVILTLFVMHITSFF